MCFFVSDLHGSISRYEKLFTCIREEQPGVVLIGGDLLPHAFAGSPDKMNAEEFAVTYLPRKFRELRDTLGKNYPEIMIIMGNDDPRYLEEYVLQVENEELWHYLHMKKISLFGFTFAGYAMVPPTPFQLKDWERYDVSRYVDPGCVAPTEGFRTVDPDADAEYTTIKDELEALSEGMDVSRSVWLFHSPPYQTSLDRADLDGMRVDHVPLDVHVGSIAIRRFIEERQPYLSLHGHIHESVKLTGSWYDSIGRTLMMNASHSGRELSLVKFQLNDLEIKERILL